MRYANITSIPSSYIVAFFSSLGDASPPGEDVMPLGEEEISTGEDAMLQLGNKRRISIYSCYLRSQ